MDSALFDCFTPTLLLVLTVVLPAAGVWDYRRMSRGIREGRSGIRMKVYVSNIAVMWPLTVGFLGWWLLSGQDLGSLGLVAEIQGRQWFVVSLGAAATVFVLIQMVMVTHDPEQLQSVRQQFGELCEIAPRTPAERSVFVLVCITAGVCEELLYRGLLTGALAGSLGTWPAVVLATAIFGLGHVYQGWVGMGKSMVGGLMMSVLALGSGSLLVPIVVHVVNDLTAGRMLGASVRGKASGYGT